jgi:hypothetical protein
LRSQYIEVNSFKKEGQYFISQCLKLAGKNLRANIIAQINPTAPTVLKVEKAMANIKTLCSSSPITDLSNYITLSQSKSPATVPLSHK